MKIKVNISDGKVSTAEDETLITYALGSCIGLTLYDPKVAIGGMLHCLLPDSHENPEKARQHPFTYADSGLVLLLERIFAQGAKKQRLQVVIAGGAQRLQSGRDVFDVGKRNYLAIKKGLWQQGLFIKTQDVGGHAPRTMSLQIANGTVTLKSGNKVRTV